MSISPISTSGYYPRPTANTAPAVAPAANAQAEAPLVVTPVGQIKTDPLGDSLRSAKDVVNAAMNGKSIPGASGFQAAALGLIQKGQAAVSKLVSAVSPVKAAAPTVSVAATTPVPPKTTLEKAKQIGRSALFFAAPIGAAAAGAALLGWFVGPLVPIIGGHVFGAVAAALAVGHTSGMLLHGAMRLPLVTNPADRELNSAGVTIGSAAIGMGLAAAITAAAGATIGLPVLAAGAALGAAPRLMEWWLGRL
jgi:hypothetical protein